MPETWVSETFANGVKVASVSRVASDAELLKTRAPDRLRAAYSTLRTWASDAATTNTNWPTMTAAQKDAATRETIRRLGVFLDNVGDLLLHLSLDA